MLAEPATTIRTERRGMDTFEDEILLFVDHVGLRTGIAAPEHIDEVLALCSECLDGSIRKLLPAQRRVAVCLMRSHRQRGIQQQHPLFGPARQIA